MKEWERDEGGLLVRGCWVLLISPERWDQYKVPGASPKKMESGERTKNIPLKYCERDISHVLVRLNDHRVGCKAIHLRVNKVSERTIWKNGKIWIDTDVD